MFHDFQNFYLKPKFTIRISLHFLMILVCRRVLEVGVPIFLCAWHLFKNWKKVTFQRICDVMICTQVFNELRNLMYTWLEHGECPIMFISTLNIRAQLMFDNMGNAINEFTSYFWHCYGPIFGEYVNFVPTYIFIVLHQVFQMYSYFFVILYVDLWALGI
jgi:hypothetical protein